MASMQVLLVLQARYLWLRSDDIEHNDGYGERTQEQKPKGKTEPIRKYRQRANGGVGVASGVLLEGRFRKRPRKREREREKQPHEGDSKSGGQIQQRSPQRTNCNQVMIIQPFRIGQEKNLFRLSSDTDACVHSSCEGRMLAFLSFAEGLLSPFC